MPNTPASLLCDFYKLSHRAQYPPATEVVYSTWIPRNSLRPNVSQVIAFGFQAFIQEYLIDYFHTTFFSRPEQEVVDEYVEFVTATLGAQYADGEHIRMLHQLGYLPVKIKAVPEGTRVPIGVPMLTIENTRAEFFWVTNYIETLLSMELWLPSTTATIADEYYRILEKYAKKTGSDSAMIKFQGHDFSARGMSSVSSCEISGTGHLLSFVGTDNIPAIFRAAAFYDADVKRELVGTSIPATEHSVMCSYGQHELDTYRHLIADVYPTGFVSIVSDTWNLWDVITETLPALSKEIMARQGKLVIRPDSGDPVKILCGDPYAKDPRARDGVVWLLWKLFGGTVNKRGYRELDEHVGVIYGDAITTTRCEEICDALAWKSLASSNVVFGIGSYTYQYNTRDTFGFALKSTSVTIAGVEQAIFKDPVTDAKHVKKSKTGRVAVVANDNALVCIDNLTQNEEEEIHDNLLRTVFVDGSLVQKESFETIRQRVAESRSKVGSEGKRL